MPSAALQLTELFGTTLAGFVFVGWLDRGLVGALNATAFGAGLAGLMSATYLLRIPAKWDRAVLRESMRITAPFIPHFIALWLQNFADRWALKINGGAAEIGAYSVGIQLSMPSALVIGAWNQERGARTGETYREGGLAALRPQMGAIRRSYLLAALLPLIPIVIAFPLLRMIVGSKLESGVAFVVPMVIIGAIESLYHPHNHVVYYTGKVGAIPVATGITAIVSLAASYPLTRAFGVYGALAARALTGCTKAGVMWVAAERVFRAAERDALSADKAAEKSPTA
jgi:O-antigen/teichoic acid export membrane protein